MKARLALAVALMSAAACADEKKEQGAPTAPPVAKSAVVAPAPTPPSTVCLRYASQRALVTAELADKPSSEALQKKLTSLDRLIKDACQ